MGGKVNNIRVPKKSAGERLDVFLSKKLKISRSQTQKMIEEMNSIYRHYKAKFPKSTVRNIINAFIAEINRMFGFIKQAEIDKLNRVVTDQTKDQEITSLKQQLTELKLKKGFWSFLH